MGRSRFLGLFALTLALGCGEGDAPAPVALADAPLISGVDDRRPPDQAADPLFAEDARGFVASLVVETRLEEDRDGNPYLDAPPLYERHRDGESDVELCRDERFAHEPTPAFCSGTLIAPDLLLTAGHCVLNDDECDETLIVFGFEADASSEVLPLDEANIYRCAELIAQSEPDFPDYALLRLDRPATGREPAKVVRDERSLPLGIDIAIAGHPIGLPLKITLGGKTSVAPFGYGLDEPDYFVADVDTFPGNSGSGGYLSATDNQHALVGVLSSVIDIGSYAYDAERDCERYSRHSAVTVWLTYSHHAISALCAVRAASYPQLCGCGNGTCNAAWGEDGTTCATDCDDACGDHLCLGEETRPSCGQDCGTCGDGVCAPGEDCCTDCGCEVGFDCESALCVPDVESGEPGSSCAMPLPLEATGTHTLHTPSQRALCYRFELAAEATVRFRGDAATAPQICASASCPPNTGTGPELTLAAGAYYLKLPSDVAATPRTFEVSFASAQPHDGLTCAAAIELEATGTAMVAGTTTGSWSSTSCTLGSTQRCFGPERHYAFTLEQPASITAIASGFEHIALALRDAACTPASALEAAVDVSGSGSARLHRVLQPGTYRIVVDGEARFDHGAYALEVSFSAPPVSDGDDCDDPIVLEPTGAYSVSGDTTYAANDYSGSSSVACNARTFGNDRFYTFTLTEKTRVDARVDAMHDAALLLTGGECADPIRCVTGATEIRRVLNPGTYALIVDGQENYDAGPYTLALEFTASPPLEGESCEDALPVTPSGVQHLTGTVANLADDIDAACAAGTSFDRVYTFTLAEQRTLLITVLGESGANVALSTSCARSDGWGCLALGSEARVQNRTLQPGTYFLLIDAEDSEGGGAYDVTIDFESAPLGKTCFDALPIEVASTPATFSSPGHQTDDSHFLYYQLTLTEPSQLELSVEAPATFWLRNGPDAIYRPSGELSTEVPPGTYCVQLGGELGGPAFELTASARPLAERSGRGCADAVLLAAPGVFEREGYTSFGHIPECASLPVQLYEFELTEPKSFHASVSAGFSLALLRDDACSQVEYCSGGTRTLNASLEAGRYALAVAGPPFITYDLVLEIECDGDDACAVIEPEPDAGHDAGEPEPSRPDAGGDGGAPAPEPDSGVLEPDAMTAEPIEDASILEPPLADAGQMHDASDDASTGEGSASASSGCACRTAAPRSKPRAAVLASMSLALAVLLRIRRRLR